MALDIYFKEDILNVLRATYAASEGSATLVADIMQDPELRNVPLDKLLRIYRRGFNTAIGAVGLGFGLDSLCQQRGGTGQSLARAPGPATCDNRPSEPTGTMEATKASLRDLDLLGFLWAKAQHEGRKM